MTVMKFSSHPLVAVLAAPGAVKIPRGAHPQLSHRVDPAHVARVLPETTDQSPRPTVH